MKVLVTGAGGFIGGHLTAGLLARGVRVRAVDVKPRGAWWQWHEGAENWPGLNVAGRAPALAVCAEMDEVFHLAADMGGMGFIESHKAECDLNILLDAHMLQGAQLAGVRRYFYASTACVYRADRQDAAEPLPLREDVDVYPASPEDGYGWEKLTAEKMAGHFAADFGMVTRVGRLHSTYGPHGTWEGGREKVPAALCRKVAQAVLSGEREIELWGDGKQARSFMYVGDAVEGILRVAAGDWPGPLNIGAAGVIRVADLAHLIADIAGIGVTLRHVPGPLGVRGRSSDNTLIRRHLGWEPSVPLRTGLERTYAWVRDQVVRSR